MKCGVCTALKRDEEVLNTYVYLSCLAENINNFSILCAVAVGLALFDLVGWHTQCI